MSSKTNPITMLYDDASSKPIGKVSVSPLTVTSYCGRVQVNGIASTMQADVAKGKRTGAVRVAYFDSASGLFRPVPGREWMIGGKIRGWVGLPASPRRPFQRLWAGLPTSLAAAEWREDPNFNAAEAVLADPGLKTVYKTAIEKGCAIVTTPAA